MMMMMMMVTNQLTSPGGNKPSPKDPKVMSTHLYYKTLVPRRGSQLPGSTHWWHHTAVNGDIKPNAPVAQQNVTTDLQPATETQRGPVHH
jgi:hypothetical protein